MFILFGIYNIGYEKYFIKICLKINRILDKILFFFVIMLYINRGNFLEKTNYISENLII